MSSYARMVRVKEIVDTAKKNDVALTEEELDQILKDAEAIYTPEVYDLIALLIQQLREERTRRDKQV